jgi:hypothetical protein
MYAIHHSKNKKAVQLNGFSALLVAHPVQTAGGVSHPCDLPKN